MIQYWGILVVYIIDTILYFLNGKIWVAIICILFFVANLWSFGLIHNYSYKMSHSLAERIRENRKFEGRYPDGNESIEDIESAIKKVENRFKPDYAPLWIRTLHFLTSLLAFLILLPRIV